MLDAPPILVLAAQRTGTTLLRASLATDPRVLDLIEFLNPQPETHHKELGFWAKNGVSDKRHLGDGTDQDAMLSVFENYLAEIRRSHPGRIVLADLKYNHVGIVDTLWRDADLSPAPLQAFLNADAAVVHIFRRNPLAQLCSLQLALSSGLWVSWQPVQPDQLPRLRINVRELVDNLQRIEFRVTIADWWLHKYRRVLKIAYEDLLVGNSINPAIQAQLKDCLGYELKIRSTPTKKIAPPISELIENLPEVERALKGSQYAWCLWDGTEKPSPHSRLSRPQPSPSQSRPLIALSSREWAGNSKRIIICSELPTDLRHFLSIQGLRKEIRSIVPSAEIIFALNDLSKAALVLGADAVLLQAPRWPISHYSRDVDRPASFVDILTKLGFAEPNKLRAMTHSWATLLEMVEPDLIIADNSPAALLAAYGGKVPVISMGTGYTMPPLDFEQFPPLHGDREPSLPEAQLLSVVRAVQAELGRMLPNRLHEIFDTRARVVIGAPELDPYRSFRREELHALTAKSLPPEYWFSELRLYVELGSATARTDAVLMKVAELDCPVEVYFQGGESSVREKLMAHGKVVHTRAPCIDDVLRRASHVLSCGESFLSAAAFAAGRPQLIAPYDDESWHTYRQLRSHGLAWLLDLDSSHQGWAKLLNRFMADRQLPETSSEWASRIWSRPTHDAENAILFWMREISP